MLDHFKSSVRKVTVQMAPFPSPYLFISLAEASFTNICKTTGVLDELALFP